MDGPPPTYDELVAENERLRERLGMVEPRIAELERVPEPHRGLARDRVLDRSMALEL